MITLDSLRNRVRYRGLQAPTRLRMFTELARLDIRQTGWDEMFRLLYRGQLAAAQANLPELEARMADGQTTILDALRQTGQFHDWEMALLQAGLATGDLQGAFARLAEHYQLQCQFAEDLQNQLRWPLLIAALVLLVAMGVTLVNGQVGLAGAVLRLLVGGAGLVVLLWLLAWLVDQYRRQHWPVVMRRAMLQLPGVRQLYRAWQRWHFFAGFEQAVASGLPLTQALRLAIRFLPGGAGRVPYRQLADQVAGGEKLSAALRRSGLMRDLLLGPLDAANASALDAQRHLTQAARLAYIEQLLFWARWLPQLVYPLLPIGVLLYLLSL